MSMAFHFGFMETILFSFWKIDTMSGTMNIPDSFIIMKKKLEISGLISSMIGIFLMSMLYEGLKVFREYLLQKSVQLTGVELNTSNGGANGSAQTASGAGGGGNGTGLGNGSNQALRIPLAGEADSVQEATLAMRTYFRYICCLKHRYYDVCSQKL